MLNWFKSLIGTSNERTLAKLQPLVDRINELEAKTSKYTDEQLQGKTAEFKEKIANGADLDDLLPIAFAVVREASKRVLGMRPYDVQLIGGITLHEGRIAEMKTGEGKTLVATLPMYLNALSGDGAHLVTVNDYLAARDAEWMGQVFRFLGLSVGTIVSNMPDPDRRRSYACDITYGTNNEFGFDYLRDNMKFSLDRRVQRKLNYAIVDEVDSILIDEARTPLIISGPADKSSEWYYRINAVIPFLKREEDFIVDEKANSVTLTDAGVDKVEDRLKVGNLYTTENIEILHHVNQALKAHTLFKKDANYVVEDGKVVIVDEFTGRKMSGRRWSDGLHQAVEAKEGVRIEQENETLATITFQNFFRLYDKLAGMTGTADTEATEFAEIYELEVAVIPTNKPIVRDDQNDLIYKTEREKWFAVADEVAEAHDNGQPVLVGTTSVEKSEYLSSILDRKGIVHHVLNAKFHAMEAEIVAQAGRKGAVTIATNMAGRGTDIVLGGNPEELAERETGTDEGPEFVEALKRYTEQCKEEKEEVIEAGGLFVVGTERHESRRVDNQLRGRAGRQGDPGRSRFFLSLDDDLMRVFGSDRIKKVMDTLKLPEGEPIEHKWINKAVENAQQKIEGRNYDLRKNLLEYDDVMNLQRKALYSLREEILTGDQVHAKVREAIDDVVYAMCDQYLPEGALDAWDREALQHALKAQFTVDVDFSQVKDQTSFEDFKSAASEQVGEAYDTREKAIIDKLQRAAEAQGNPVDEEVARERWRFFERERYLRAIDQLWKHHLKVMDSLRQGVSLQGYGQKDPKQVYKKEGYELFQMMVEKIKENVTETLFRAEGPTEEEIQRMRQKRLEEEQKLMLGRGQMPGQAQGKADKEPEGRVVHSGGTYERKLPKIGRNDPCPCGSGKKFKKCHDGKLDELAAILQRKGDKAVASGR
ncbi:MAG: preprotein translocase subunit SecA [Myxococcota bacterium]